jgi:hypothetical protein
MKKKRNKDHIIYYIVPIHLVRNKCMELYTHSLTLFMEWCLKKKNLVTHYLCLFCLNEVLKQLHCLSSDDCCSTNKVKKYNFQIHGHIFKFLHHIWIQFNILYFVMFGYNKDKKKKSHKAWWQMMSYGHLPRQLKYTLWRCSVLTLQFWLLPTLYPKMWINSGFIQRVSTNAWTNFRSKFPHTKTKEQFITIYARKHLIFEIQPNMLTSILRMFLSNRTLKNPSIFSSKWKWRHFTNTFLMTVKPSAMTLEPLKGCEICDQTCPCMQIQVEDILSICCELWLDKQ